MTLLDEILTWTQTRPLWQQDAARRLFETNSGLASRDFEELYLLLKAAHGLPVLSSVEPIPLSQEHLPSDPTAGEKVVLHSLSSLRQVNRIPSNQTVPFAPQGVTIIYGENGSGKSGYARVLKHACRARDQGELIHPDANLDDLPSEPPSAVFEIEVEGSKELLDWNYGEVPPEKLSTIALFDTRCARSYLTNEHDVAYLPYGLDVIENLAQSVLPELSQKLQSEIDSINKDQSPFAHLLGDTVVGKQIENIGAQSKKETLEGLGVLSVAETQELTRLNKSLSEADPLEKAKAHELRYKRLKGWANGISSRAKWVNSDQVERFKQLVVSKVDAEEAETKAAEVLRSGETLLPGTGDKVWKVLFEAARKYSLSVAYPDHPYPNTSSDAVCPLCQSELDQQTQDRLNRFEKYVKNDVAKAAKTAREALESAVKKVRVAELKVVLDEAARDELNALDDTVVACVESFCDSLHTRRDAMLECAKTQAWDNLPEVSLSPIRMLRHLAARELLESRSYRRATDTDKKNGMLRERDELLARQKLSKVLPAVLSLLVNLKMIAKLEACKHDLKPRGISMKAKSLASSVVTKGLSTALDDEFSDLGLSHVKTCLRERMDHGKMYHQILLDLPSEMPLEEILSEGEQRAIALGAFFAELSMASHECGIIFDDPVSSLDHNRRLKVAGRLIREAKARQVIVFTHDTSFLGELLDEVERTNCEAKVQFLQWYGGVPGNVSDGLPWEHVSWKDRIDKLEKKQRELLENASPYPDEEQKAAIANQYSLMRATIERIIQDLVFNGVIKRYRDWIKVSNLKAVTGFQKSEYEVIDRLDSKCDDVCNAHDPSSAKSSPLPTAEELGQDIQELKTVADIIRNRMKSSGN